MLWRGNIFAVVKMLVKVGRIRIEICGLIRGFNRDYRVFIRFCLSMEELRGFQAISLSLDLQQRKPRSELQEGSTTHFIAPYQPTNNFQDLPVLGSSKATSSWWGPRISSPFPSVFIPFTFCKYYRTVTIIASIPGTFIFTFYSIAFFLSGF